MTFKCSFKSEETFQKYLHNNTYINLYLKGYDFLSIYNIYMYMQIYYALVASSLKCITRCACYVAAMHFNNLQLAVNTEAMCTFVSCMVPVQPLLLYAVYTYISFLQSRYLSQCISFFRRARGMPRFHRERRVRKYNQCTRQTNLWI